LDKTSRSRRTSKHSKQVEMRRAIKEEQLLVEGDICKAGGGGVRDGDGAFMDDSKRDRDHSQEEV